MISTQLVTAVKEFEGLHLTAYRCPGGVWTLGYGRTLGVREGMSVSPAGAERWLLSDLEAARGSVLRLTRPLQLRASQLDALTDFVYNLGAGAFERSTLRRRILEGAPDALIQEEFRRWVFVGRRRLPGLVSRREWEARLWVDR